MATEAQVRLYRDGDEEAVVALWSGVFPSPSPWNDPRFVIAKKTTTQRDLFFVAVVEGSVVGTAMGGYDGHRGWLYTVAVHPDWQRRAIGTALVRRVEVALIALGCPKLNLQVVTSNAGVVAFYARLGYAVEERVSMGKRLGA
jgi:ribosomal protein S18 acetylase RimI-like enzyme